MCRWNGTRFTTGWFGIRRIGPPGGGLRRRVGQVVKWLSGGDELDVCGGWLMQAKRDIPLEQRHGHSLLVVRLIAVGKLFKAACLLVVGGFILHSIRAQSSVHDMLLEVINAMRIDEH